MSDVEGGTKRAGGEVFKTRFQPTTLQCINVDYAIGGKPILRDISATFAPSQVAALMGPSGAGSETQRLLKVCSKVFEAG